MWPTLISVGPLAIQSFGFFIFLGIFLGGFVWWQKGREEGFEEEVLMDNWLIGGVAALVGARIWQVLTLWPEFGGSWYKMVFVPKYPGLAYEGALVGGILALLILGTKKGWNLWKMFEVGVFSFLTVEMFGWLGSFLGGSQLGKVTSWWWGVGFPGVEGRRHPVQLLWVLGLWLGFRLLRKWEKEYRGFKWYQREKDEAKPGFLVAGYLMGLGGLRMGLSWLMESGKFWFGLSLFILGSLILVERSGIKVGLVKKPAKDLRGEKLTELKKRKKQGFDFK